LDPGVGYGLGSAIAFGAGDFTGGAAGRRAPALLVAAGAQATGLLLLLAAAFILRPALPDAASIALGAAAGVFGGLGLVALYRGLSMGSMGVVTAISGVGSVAIPLLFGALVLRTPVGALQWLGVAAAIAAGAAAGGATLAGVSQQALRLAFLAALGLGAWFVLLDRAAQQHELWALVASRGAATVLVGGLALARWRGGAPRPVLPLIALAGILDVAGNAGYVLSAVALSAGVAAALSGLYPIITMLLAALILRDRLPVVGVVAVVLAVAGIVLISLG
jgi:drug/metabolite transporter (DMT)-like permease